MGRLSRKIKQLARVSKLAPGIPEKIRFVLWFVWLAIRHRFGVDWGKEGRIVLRYAGANFDFYSYYSTDIATLEEVFLRREYELDAEVDPKIIFDIGSNTGVSVAFLRLKYPKAKIYAFEPDPDVFKRLLVNVRNVGDAEAFNFALSDVDGPITFYSHPKSSIVSSLTPRFPEQKETTVNGRTLNTAMNELGVSHIDLLKFDVEGAERIIFSVADTSRIGAFVGEFHSDLAAMSVTEFSSLFPEHEIGSRAIGKERYMVWGRKLL